MSLVAQVPGLTYFDNPQAGGRTLNVWNAYYYRVSAVIGGVEGIQSPPATYYPYFELRHPVVPVPGLSIWGLLID
jgi:hypothetical protein